MPPEVVKKTKRKERELISYASGSGIGQIIKNKFGEYYIVANNKSSDRTTIITYPRKDFKFLKGKLEMIVVKPQGYVFGKDDQGQNLAIDLATVPPEEAEFWKSLGKAPKAVRPSKKPKPMREREPPKPKTRSRS